jgi:hypothetical protein
MTFDQFANQGDTAAWDPDAAAATKKAADKIFAGEPDDTEEDSGDTSIKQDPHPPDQVPDPDITSD